MIRADRGYARLAAWLAVTLLLAFTLYSGQLTVLTSGLGVLLSSTLGSVFPAYPFLALLLLLVALRWRDFHEVLLSERGLKSKPVTRLVGAAMVVVPAALWALVYGQGNPTDYVAMELAAASFVVAAYGCLLAINPSMWKIMLPYALLCALGLVSPLFMVNVLGPPLAALSSYLAAGMTSALGLHIAWQGVSFSFVSTTGETISSVVTPACSAAYSITIYLGLLGLMYLDVGKGVATTVKFALVGSLVIPLLDSARIAAMIWMGFLEGSGAFWSIHDWLGYAIFFAFYIVVLVAYSRADRLPSSVRPAPAL